MSKFKTYPLNTFQMTDLCEIQYFTGIKIDRKDDRICLSQSAYIINALKNSIWIVIKLVPISQAN